MATISFEFDPSTFSALRLAPIEFAREMRIAAAVQWYAQGIVSQGKAAELAKKHMESGSYTAVGGLRDTLENKILAQVPSTFVNGDRASRLPNTTSIAFEYVEGEAILLMLNEYGICASSGSACTSGSLEPSHVLRAMGVPFTAAHGSIRFSLSRYTTRQEVDFVLEKLPPVIARLRQMSPFWKSARREARG